ncbi:MAG: amino acid racemase [Caulobacterales bacterium]|nr:amino acid racemase [Caulobacterales bacterium]
MKTLGVLGGMGPAATLDFLAKLQAATPAGRDQDHLRVLVDINPQVPDRNDPGNAPGPVLAAMAVGLRDAGAEVLAIACNTAHAYTDEVRAASGLPLVDMIDIACQSARLGGADRVGILATGLALVLYTDRLKGMGLEPVCLSKAKQEWFMSLLYRIKAGDVGEEVQDEIVAVAESLVEAGAQAVIAGCTEVPLVLSQDELDVPLIDAGQVLAERCVAVCRGSR